MADQENDSLETLGLQSWYTSSRADLVESFYVPCLSRASQYDRAVGFFSSSLYVVVGAAIADFIQRGGQIRLICSPHLSEADVQAIERGYSQRARVEENLIEDIRLVAADADKLPAVELLATLIGFGFLDIRVAYRPNTAGIFHSKIGLFRSETAAVAFTGSVNESQAAFVSGWNHESFVAFTSWSNETDRLRVKDIADYFDSLWAGDEDGIEVVDFPDLARDELRPYENARGVPDAVDRALASVPSLSPRSLPARPVSLMAHQVQALANWENAAHRGIVKHATGSGKTLTALEAVGRWIKSGRPALLLVPSDLLSAQWVQEIKSFLGAIDPNLLIVGGGRASPDWEADLSDFTRDAVDFGPRIVIATMQSAANRRFIARVADGGHLLMVADEVHRLGSRYHREALRICAGGRLALSATPKRYGDPEGTSVILSYFGEVLEPVFEISDAIRVGRLVPYDYHIVEVELAGSEQERWDALSDEIRRAYARLPEVDGVKVQSERLKMLLIRRARILKQAQAKVDAAERLVTKEYRKGDRWLIYCDDGAQLRGVVSALQDRGVGAIEYWTGSAGAREEGLEYFKRHGGVLVAIRCLDEGVDIPSLDHALILASSSNPREFIQRRGRVLRRAPGKVHATIYDAVVVPASMKEEGNDRMPILKAEFKRVAEFARHAQNQATSYELRRIASRLGLDDPSDFAAQFEEEEDG